MSSLLHDETATEAETSEDHDSGSSLRTPASWVAYGRFLAHAISTSSANRLCEGPLKTQYFRRSILGRDSRLVCAFQDASQPVSSVWMEAEAALRFIAEKQPVDQLHVFVGGDLADSAAPPLHHALDDSYIGFAETTLTREVLELQPTFEEFLMALGPNNRRHMRGRQKKAQQANLQFEFTSDPRTVTAKELNFLGAESRPRPYSPAFIAQCDTLAQSRQRFIRCHLRSPEGALLSTSTLFAEGDTAVMMYQLNDRNRPELGLTMTLRGYMIQRCIESGLRRLVLPRGVSGHLEHAASSNSVTQVLFVRTSAKATAKAMLMRFVRPNSIQARMFQCPGFFPALFDRRASVHPPRA